LLTTFIRILKNKKNKRRLYMENYLIRLNRNRITTYMLKKHNKISDNCNCSVFSNQNNLLTVCHYFVIQNTNAVSYKSLMN